MAEVLTQAQVQAAQDAGASPSDVSQLQRLKDRVAEFLSARQHLLEIGPAVARSDDEQLMAEYGELLERADFLESKISAATSAVDQVIRWGRGALGLDGVRELGQLGVVWFLPATVIAGAVALIGYWLADYAKFARKFREQQRIAEQLRQQGVDPAEAERQAAAAVAQTVPSWLAPLTTPLGLAALVVGGYLVWRASR